MDTEIKLVDAPVEKALASLKTSIQSLELFPYKDIGGENSHDMVTKLNDINQAIENVLTSYQTLILNHEEATRKSLETLKQSEANVASKIQLLK